MYSIDDLLRLAVPAQTRKGLRQAVHDAVNRNDPVTGTHARPAYRQTYQLDLLTAAFELPETTTVGRPAIPVSLSPLLWDGNRLWYRRNNQMRESIRVVADAVRFWRFQSGWHVRLLDLDRLARDILSNFDNNVATPSERMSVLPRVLQAIKDGTFRVCFIPLSEDNVTAPDDLHRYTCADEWATGIRLAPRKKTGTVEWLELGDYRRDMNRHLQEEIGRKHPELGNLELSSMQQAYESGALYQIARETLRQLTERTRNYWVTNYTPDEIESAMQRLELVKEAIENDTVEDLVNLPGDVRIIKHGYEELRQVRCQLENFCREIEADVEAPPLPEPPVDGTKSVQNYDDTDESDFLDRITFTNDRIAYWDDISLLSGAARWQYDVLLYLFNARKGELEEAWSTGHIPTKKLHKLIEEARKQSGDYDASGPLTLDQARQKINNFGQTLQNQGAPLTIQGQQRYGYRLEVLQQKARAR